ncbi:hypothetical protein [Streptomyces chrestomyceticus]|uniref:hypothetical protein n=1 Tax=Streptomyces chrestomyceticus TaxID=68185 RepID=UPI0033E53F57
MTANGFIRRGPMAADVFEKQFTQVHNAVFRDRRMSYKAKGIFGLISTHKDGFGLSIESLTAFSTDGASSVRTGLNELEEFGYLQRTQHRLDGPTEDNPKAKKGGFGPVEYFITDMPDGLIISLPAPEGGERQNPSSEPSCENRTTEENRRSGPSCDFPQTDEPHAEDPRRKKINPNNNNSLSGSSSSPKPQKSAEVTTEGRENSATPDKTTPASAAAVAAAFAEQWKAERGTRPSRRTVEAVAIDAAEAVEDGDEVGWLMTSVVPFMVARKYVDLGRAKTHQECPPPRGAKLPGQRPAVPDWCGECNDGLRPDLVAERYRKKDGRLIKCGECHPGAAKQPAAV